MSDDDGPKASVGSADELLHHHSEFPRTRLSNALDAGLIALGKTASWLWLVAMLVIIGAVVGRYAFGIGTLTLSEWFWHISGAAWLIGLSYTLAVDDHVRVDFLHERFGLRTKAWVEFFGILVLLFPFLFFAAIEAVPFAYISFEQGERSAAPAGLGNRWVLKAFLAAAFILLAVAAFSRLLRVTALLFGFPAPMAPRRPDKGGA